MNLKLWILILIGFGLPNMVWAQSTSSNSEDSAGKTKVSAKSTKAKAKKKVNAQENNPTLNSLQGGGSGWRLQATIAHNPKLRATEEATTDFLTRADYTINRKHRIRFQQSFTKLYDRYESENEIQPFDTVVAHFYRPKIDFFKKLGVGFLWRNHLTIPISDQSVNDDLITRYQTSAIMSKGFLQNKLLAFAVPYGIYHFYKYQTIPGRRLLPHYTLGMSLGSLYFITPRLSFYSGLVYNWEAQRNSQFEDSPTQTNTGTYRFDLDLSYQFTNHWTGSVSYFQGANYTRDGRYEVVLFDPNVSRVNFGFTYIY